MIVLTIVEWVEVKGLPKREPVPRTLRILTHNRNSDKITRAITKVTKSIRNPKKRVFDDVVTELDQIADFSDLDAEIAHEWLTIHVDMVTIFLYTKDKGAWILRRLPKIRSDNFTVIMDQNSGRYGVAVK